MAACGVASSLVSSVLSTRSLATATASRATSAACAAFLPVHSASPANVPSIVPVGNRLEVVRSRFFGQTDFGARQTTFHGAALASKAIHGNARTAMTIKVGDEIPDATLSYFDSENNMQVVSAKDLVKGKKVVLFAVPGAFTPTCSLKHLPSFIENADKLKAKGVDTIACIAVNDAFVMQAWGKSVGAEGKVLLLADGSGQFAKALGVELDLVDKGLGIRSRRYSMLVDDGKVAALNLEEGGAFSTSGADDILKVL